MAVAQIYTAVANDTITAARWNNEFGNIYNNGTDIAFPLTKSVSWFGFTMTLDSAGVTTINSTGSQGYIFTPGAKAGTPSVASGKTIDFVSHTFTDNNTAVSGTAAAMAFVAFQRPTLSATNAGVTTTDAATIYIANSPANGTNETITNPWAVWVDNGAVRLDGDLILNSSKMLGDSTDPGLLRNFSLSGTISANTLTIALKTRAGADASTYTPIDIAFRNATLTTASQTDVKVTSALSLVVSAGSTLGTVSGQASRLWVGILNNAGTAELFVYNSLSSQALGAFPQAITGPSIKWLFEHDLITTTAEGGAGAADSAQVPYSTTARTNVAFRWLGFIESTQTTAGTWAQAITEIHEITPYTPPPGTVLQYVINSTGQVATGTTAIPNDNTTPLITEGDQYLSQAITPKHACNVIRVHGLLNVAHSANLLTAVTINDGTTVWAVSRGSLGAINQMHTIPFIWMMVAGTTSATTWAIRAGSAAGATMSVNGAAGAVIQNIAYSHVAVEEIMV